jgi:hypothetical protein
LGSFTVCSPISDTFFDAFTSCIFEWCSSCHIRVLSPQSSLLSLSLLKCLKCLRDSPCSENFCALIRGFRYHFCTAGFQAIIFSSECTPEIQSWKSWLKVLFFFFRYESHYVAQAGLELLVQPLKWLGLQACATIPNF